MFIYISLNLWNLGQASNNMLKPRIKYLLLTYTSCYQYYSSGTHWLTYSDKHRQEVWYKSLHSWFTETIRHVNSFLLARKDISEGNKKRWMRITDEGERNWCAPISLEHLSLVTNWQRLHFLIPTTYYLFFSFFFFLIGVFVTVEFRMTFV